MARPMKTISIGIKNRNSKISAEKSKFILDSTIKISRKIASKWKRYADVHQLSIEITTETLLAILTSDKFSPERSEAELYCYIRRTAETKAVSLTRNYQKALERFADFNTMKI